MVPGSAGARVGHASSRTGSLASAVEPVGRRARAEGLPADRGLTGVLGGSALPVQSRCFRKL